MSGVERLRAIDVSCTECGAHPGNPCMEKPRLGLSLEFARREIKSLHPVRYEDASMARICGHHSITERSSGNA